MHVPIQFSQHHLLKTLSLFHCMLLPPLSNINSTYRRGFITWPSVLFYWYICLLFWQYQPVFITAALYYSLISGVVISSSLFFFNKIVETLWGPFWFHIFEYFFYFCEICHWYFDRNCVECIYYFG